jgi:hypothetical protein
LAVKDVFGALVTLLPSEAFATDGVVWAQSAEGIFRSNDGGRSFAPVVVGDPGATTTSTPQMALAPGYGRNGSQTAYAAVLQIVVDKVPSKNPSTRAMGGIFRTVDGGASWQVLPPGGIFQNGAVAVGAAQGGRLFGGYLVDAGHGGVLCSADGGATWRAACPAQGGPHAPTAQEGSAGSCTGGSCTSASGGNTGAAAGGGSSSASAGVGDAGTASGAASGNAAAATATASATSGGGSRVVVAVLGALLAAGAAGAGFARYRVLERARERRRRGRGG